MSVSPVKDPFYVQTFIYPPFFVSILSINCLIVVFTLSINCLSVSPVTHPFYFQTYIFPLFVSIFSINCLSVSHVTPPSNFKHIYFPVFVCMMSLHCLSVSPVTPPFYIQTYIFPFLFLYCLYIVCLSLLLNISSVFIHIFSSFVIFLYCL
jgi:hypothetical protein